MAQQIRFFKKNKIDLSNQDISLSVTDDLATDAGNDFINFVRNRNNVSAWLTTGSADANNTTIDINLVDVRAIDTILLVGHNLKSFTIQWYDDLAGTWEDFSTPVDVTSNEADTNVFDFEPVNTSQVKIVIAGTQVADSDKRIKQIIVTEKVGSGQFEGWPEIKPELSLDRRTSSMLSGKVNVVESQGNYSVELSVNTWRSDNDLSIVEDLYFNRQGFLVWPCGGDQTQFSSVRRGYRLEDIYYMKPVDEYKPKFSNAYYKAGLALKIKLSEAV